MSRTSMMSLITQGVQSHTQYQVTRTLMTLSITGDKDDDEGNDIIMGHKFYDITFQVKRLVETHRIFQSKVNVMQNYLVCC